VNVASSGPLGNHATVEVDLYRIRQPKPARHRKAIATGGGRHAFDAARAKSGWTSER